MTLIKFTLIPESGFASRLKGDTLFGQFCWMVYYRHGESMLETLLKAYEERPFIIFSDPFPPGYLPKPTLPPSMLGEDPDTKKQNLRRLWMTPEALAAGKFSEAKTHNEAHNFPDGHIQHSVIVHNSLNYKTFTTGEGFDPHACMEHHLQPKEIYALVDETQFGLDKVEETLHLFGEHGYGKDVSIGKGRFRTDTPETVTFPKSTNAHMALSPFTPKGMDDSILYYKSFTRFGKSGGSRAHTDPFKKPLILADCGAVIQDADPRERTYAGKAIRGISKRYEDTVHQGYAIIWPIGGVV